VVLTIVFLGIPGVFIFGANQAAAQPTPATQGTHLFGTNPIGTPFSVVPAPAQGKFCFLLFELLKLLIILICIIRECSDQN
jgi:hypothetical protein